LKVYEKDIFQFSLPFIRGTRYHVERSWEEASKIVAWVDKIAGRVQKYRKKFIVSISI
jgi:hypothetical protein